MAEGAKISEDADALYVAIAEASRDDDGANTKVFLQEELLELSSVTDAKQLMPLVQYLTNHMLLRTLKVKGKLAWGPRPREAARQISLLDPTDRMIYAAIEEAHTNGVWSREIRKRTNIAQNAVTKSISKMEKNNLIKSIKSVKNPAQRTYMLYHLVPSEDVTGNSFFDAGDLDLSFRDELLNLIIFWVRQHSWISVKRRVKREQMPLAPFPSNNDNTNGGHLTSNNEHDNHDAVAGTTDDNNNDSSTSATANGKKRKRNAVDIEDSPVAAARPRHRHTSRSDAATETEWVQLVHRAGSHEYPTAEAVHEFLTTSEAIKPTKRASLTVPEIQGCLDVLVWDDKLERVRGPLGAYGYRTVRGVTFRQPGAVGPDPLDAYPLGNGLTQAPCGRCPVFDLCRAGGPVSPAECVYYDQWLQE